MIEDVGSIFHIMPETPPPKPKKPKKIPIILLIIEKTVVGMPLTIFFVLFLILSHRLLGS
jgi:hypothetical protein